MKTGQRVKNLIDQYYYYKSRLKDCSDWDWMAFRLGQREVAARIRRIPLTDYMKTKYKKELEEILK